MGIDQFTDMLDLNMVLPTLEDVEEEEAREREVAGGAAASDARASAGGGGGGGGGLSSSSSDASPVGAAPRVRPRFPPRTREFLRKFQRLNERVVELVTDYNLVSFMPASATDLSSILAVAAAADRAAGFVRLRTPAADKQAQARREAGRDEEGLRTSAAAAALGLGSGGASSLHEREEEGNDGDD
jgi:hypothetical protein